MTRDNNSLGNLTYGYDVLGERTAAGGSLAATGMPAPTSSASYDAANELTNWNGTTLTYDSDGDLTNDGVRAYTWDARRHLSAISGPGANASFVYGPFGRRWSKTVNGTATGFLFDGANPVQELSGTTPTANMLTGGVDEYFQRRDSIGVYGLLTDALGSTIALTNSSAVTGAGTPCHPFNWGSAIGAVAGGAIGGLTGGAVGGLAVEAGAAEVETDVASNLVSSNIGTPTIAMIGTAVGVNSFSWRKTGCQ